MPEWYFYFEKGSTKGPFERDEMDEAIRSGRIGPFDLLFKDGQEKWRPGHGFEEFKGLFSEEAIKKEEPAWVVLMRSMSQKGIQFLQRGPYSTDKVRSLLQAGELQYTDYIWREGFGNWQRISSQEVFNPPAVKWKPEHSLPTDIEINDSFEPVDVASIERARPEVIETEIMPDEAVKPDELPIVNGPPKVDVVRHTKEKHYPIVRHHSEPVSGRRKTSLVSSAVGLGALVMAGLAYQYRVEIGSIVEDQRSAREAPKQKPVVREPAPLPVVVEQAVTEVKPVPPAPPPPDIDIPPTRLEVLLSGLKTDTPEAEFRTDGSHHHGIRVVIVGEAGHILKKVSLYREIEVRWKQGDKPSLALKDLPAGAYRMTASAESIVIEREFFVGERGERFNQELEQQRKLISLPFQRERRRIVAAADDLLKIAAQGRGERVKSQAIKVDLAGWAKKNLYGVSVANAKNLVFPNHWFALKESYLDLQMKVGRGEPVGADRDLSPIRKVREAGIQASLFR